MKNESWKWLCDKGMLVDAVVFLSLYFFSLVFLYVLGRFFLKLFKNSFSFKGVYTPIFVCLLVGFSVISFSYALIKSAGQTASVFFLLVFVLSFYRKKISFQCVSTEDQPKRTIFYLANSVLILFPFIYFALVIFKSGDFYLNGVDYDNVMYSELSQYLSQTGIENKWFMHFSNTPVIKGIEPYHYSELWLNALLASTFNVNSLLSLYLVTYPVLIAVSISGILAIIEYFKKPALPELLLVVFLLFIGPIFQMKTVSYHYNTMACELPFQRYGEKFSVYYPFIILSVLLLLNGYFKESLIFLLSLSVVSSTVLPASIVFFIFIISFSKTNRWSLLYRTTLFFLLFILFYVVLAYKDSSGNAYKMLGYSDFSPETFHPNQLKLSLSNYYHAFKTNALNFIWNYIYIIPIVLYALLRKTSSVTKGLCVLLLFCFSGLLIACFFYKHPDGHQMFTNTLPLLHVVIIALLITLVYHETFHNVERMLVWCFVTLFFINSVYCSLREYRQLSAKINVSDDYLQKVKEILLKNAEVQKVGLISNTKDYMKFMMQRNSNSFYHLTYVGLNPIPINISSIEINHVSDSLAWARDYGTIRERDLYYDFAKNKLSNNPDSLKEVFIRQEGLHYLLLTPSVALPSFLNTANSKIVTDSKTKLRFVRLF